MSETVRGMLATLAKALGQQRREAPDLFAAGWTSAARLALMAALALAAVLLVQLVAALVKKQRRRALSLGAALALTAGIALWAYWPAPMVAEPDSVQSVQLLTRVPGKAEREVTLSSAQQKTLLSLLQNTRCVRGFSNSLPYTGYGQTFRIFLQTDAGEVRILAAPDSGCRYTSESKALIYPVIGYTAFYRALGELAPR